MKKNRLRILYYTHYYSGACEPRFARMHDLWHYMNRMEDPGFNYKILTVENKSIDSDRVETIFKHFRPFFRRSETSRRVIESLLLPREILKREFDVFHSIYFDNSTGRLLKKIKKKRNVKTVVGPNIIGYFKQRKGNRYDLGKMSFLEKMKSKRRYKGLKKYLGSDLVDLVFSVGKYHTKLLKEVGVNEDKIFELPPRVDPKYFSKNHSRNNENKEDVFKILYVGNFSKFKGIDVFLNALELLKKDTDISFKGILVSKGEYPIENHVSIIDDIEIVGYVDRSEVSEYYNKADVYVHPGIEEAGPSTIIESLACGTPVIATDRLAFKEYDTQDVCKFFTLGNPEELKERLIKQYEDKKNGFDQSEYLLDDKIIYKLKKI